MIMMMAIIMMTLIDDYDNGGNDDDDDYDDYVTSHQGQVLRFSGLDRLLKGQEIHAYPML